MKHMNGHPSLSLAQNANRIEPILRRANALYNHPLLRRLAEGSGDSIQEKQRDIGMQMMAVRLGSPLLMECIRLLDEAKQRATATNSGVAYHQPLYITIRSKQITIWWFWIQIRAGAHGAVT